MPETADPASHAIAFPVLDETHIARLANVGHEREARDGQVLIAAGAADYPLLVVLAGHVRIVERRDAGVATGELLIARHGRSEFVGDVDLLTGRPAVFTAVAEAQSGDQPVRVLEVDRHKLRDVAASAPDLGEALLRALLMRRDLLAGTGHQGTRLIGSRWNRDTHALREMLDRNAVPYVWLEPEADGGATDTLLASLALGPVDLPALITPGGTTLRRPAVRDAAQVLGLRRVGNAQQGDASSSTSVFDVRNRIHDLVIVGAGPAGLAAAVYAASEGLDVLVLDARAPGGQAGTSSRIENYPGFPTGISGGELARRVAIQAQRFGAVIEAPCAAASIEPAGATLRLGLDCGGPVVTRSVIVATGATYRRLGIDGEEQYAGSGVYYGATQMEATLCRGRTSVVVGGGNSAGQAAVFLSGLCERVLLLVRGDTLASSMSRYLIDRLEGSERIELHYQTHVTALEGDSENARLDAVWLEGPNGKTGVVAGGLFVMIGADPRTDWLADGPVRLDPQGFVLTGPESIGDTWPARRAPHELETSLPNVFAAGDVRYGSTKRVATAVGEGAMAVRSVHAALALPG